jgi:hypothetical protein
MSMMDETKRKTLHAAIARQSYLDKAAPIIDTLAKIESVAGCEITIQDGQIVRKESVYPPALKAAREQCLAELEQLAERFATTEVYCTFPGGSLTMEKPHWNERPDGSLDVTYPLRYDPAES